MSQTAQIIQFPSQEAVEYEAAIKVTPRVKADTDNGWFKVSTVLNQAESCVEFGKYESKIYHAVKGKTHGYHKSFDYISGSQYEKITKIRPDGSIGKGVPENKAKTIEKRLVDRKILIQKGKKVSVNTIVSDWIYDPEPGTKTSKKIAVSAKIKHPIKEDLHPLQDNSHPLQGVKTPSTGVHNKKDNNNKIITKDIVPTLVVTTLKNSTPDYSDEFIWLWENRPRRQGSDSKKKVFQCCKARIKQGATWRQMAEGMNRYKTFCQATGKLNTEFTMQMTRFFGSEEQFKEEWNYEASTANQSVFTNQPTKLSTVDRQHAAAAEYLARLNGEQGSENENGGVVASYE